MCEAPVASAKVVKAVPPAITRSPSSRKMLHSSSIGPLQAGRRSACVPSTPSPPPTRISRCKAVYQPPSSATAASELELLKQSSVVVPDSNESLAAAATLGGKQLFGARAATVSAATIAGIVAAGALGLKPYQVG